MSLSARPGPVSRHASRRRSACILAAATACASICVANDAHGQTWNNPTIGSWSLNTNWIGNVAPVSSTSTRLRFNATGTQSYTATNNFTPPFNLNAIDLNNTGTGTITLAGNAVTFGGTTPGINVLGTGYTNMSNAVVLAGNTTFGGAGTGTLTSTGAWSSSPAPTGTTGSSLINGSATANVVLSGNLSLYSVRANIGNTIMTAGNWSLSSTQHGNDVFGNVNDAGNWGFLVGDTNGQTGRFTQLGGTITAQNGLIGNAAGAIGIATFSGAATVANFSNTAPQGVFGTNYGTGTINILAGANVSARRADIGRQNNSTGNLFVSGTNSRLTVTQELDIASGVNSTANATISAGGQITMTAGLTFIGSAADSINNPVTTTGSMIVTGANSLLNVGGDGSFGSGQLKIGFGSASAAPTGTLNVLAGGRVNSFNVFAGEGNGIASLLVDGANSLWANGNQFVMNSQPLSTMSISNGGRWTNGGNAYFAQNTGDDVAINIGGGGALAHVTGVNSFTVLSGGLGFGVPAGTSTLTISTDGEYRSPVIYVADAINSRAHIAVGGANAKLTTDQIVAGNDPGAVATFDVTAGGSVTASGSTFLSTIAGANSTMSFNGAGASYVGTTIGSQLHVGGSGGSPGGAATFSVASGATAAVNALTHVYSTGTLTVGGATAATAGTFTTGNLTVQAGRVNYNAGRLAVTGTLIVSNDGRVQLSSADRTNGAPANKKMLDTAAVNISGASSFIDLNDNDMIVRSGTSMGTVAGYLSSGYNGGDHDGPGIRTSAGLTDTNTALGYLSGADYLANNGNSTFNGLSYAATDTLIKYTYYGDVDFDGVVTGVDFILMDTGFFNGLTGWANGDLDYDGTVTGVDFILADTAFFNQNGALARGVSIVESFLPGTGGPIDSTGLSDDERILWNHASSFGESFVNGFLTRAAAIPEPVSAAVLGITAGLLGRRRNKPIALRARDELVKP